MTKDELKAIRERLTGGRHIASRDCLCECDHLHVGACDQEWADIDALLAEVERLAKFASTCCGCGCCCDQIDEHQRAKALLDTANPAAGQQEMAKVAADFSAAWRKVSPSSNLHDGSCPATCANPAHWPANYPDDFTPED